MSPATFRLVLLVSLAHAMVHTFEHSLPAVEQMIGDDFEVGKERTGGLGTIWRLPFGLGALLAGYLADRFGSKRLLVIYLLGCSATAVAAWWAPSLSTLFGVMFAMGCFASIYHPAGLSLISRETTAETRGAALGWHGIFGSLGIAGAPFLAALIFSTGSVDWRSYYLLLTIPALLIAGLMTASLLRDGDSTAASRKAEADADALDLTTPAAEVEKPIPWRAFLILVAAGALSGFVYAAFLHFLPRYLDEAGLRPVDWPKESFRNTLTTIALLCAAVGQGVAGRLAKPGRLEKLLVLVLLGNVPPLVWMAVADGTQRFIAACLLAFIHFMNQPVYNSLIAQMIPASRRSTGYGFSNFLCFGIGAFGPMTLGLIADDRVAYGVLAGLAAASGLLAMLLLRGEERDTETPEQA
jgi:FSR family fosmidomycin resistance protein-like MFS transporter